METLQLQKVIRKIKWEAIDKIKEIILGFKDDDVYNMLQGTCYLANVHPMKDFDTVFADYSAREALNELDGIDFDDAWFDEMLGESSNNIFDVLNYSSWDIAAGIYGGKIKCNDDDVLRICSETRKNISMILEEDENKRNAKELFEQLITEHSKEIVNALWNINNI